MLVFFGLQFLTKAGFYLHTCISRPSFKLFHTEVVFVLHMIHPWPFTDVVHPPSLACPSYLSLFFQIAFLPSTPYPSSSYLLFSTLICIKMDGAHDDHGWIIFFPRVPFSPVADYDHSLFCFVCFCVCKVWPPASSRSTLENLLEKFMKFNRAFIPVFWPLLNLEYGLSTCLFFPRGSIVINSEATISKKKIFKNSVCAFPWCVQEYPQCERQFIYGER